MQNFINSIGEENIYIIIGIIIAIIIALLVIIIIEKVSDKKYSNKLSNYKLPKFKKNKKNETTVDMFEETKEVIPVKEEVLQPVIEKEKIKPIEKEKIEIINKQQEELTYVTEEQTKEEAKKAIEEAAKKLVYEDKPDIISPTFFEKVQEEQSIISYDELMNTNMYSIVDTEKNMPDEGNEPITMDEIFVKDEPQEEKISVIDETNLVDEIEELNDLDSNIYEEKSSKDKFKPSDVISPVFGVKREVVYEKEYNELGETINIKELEVEIKKTEEFLKELKKLKNKLD